jgi:hypothetical protein
MIYLEDSISDGMLHAIVFANFWLAAQSVYVISVQQFKAQNFGLVSIW